MPDPLWMPDPLRRYEWAEAELGVLAGRQAAVVAERDAALLALRAEHGPTELAALLGISRERVYQLLRRAVAT